MQPRAFCRAVLHDYERQWATASGHGVRHPLRLKIERLQGWCGEASDEPGAFEARLREAQGSEDAGTALLADELSALWTEVQAGRPLPFASEGG